jgi:hypothetical protein
MAVPNTAAATVKARNFLIEASSLLALDFRNDSAFILQGDGSQSESSRAAIRRMEIQSAGLVEAARRLEDDGTDPSTAASIRSRTGAGVDRARSKATG